MNSSDHYWLPVLYLGLGGIVFLVWRRWAWGSPLAAYLSFGAIVLLIAVLNRLLFTIDFLIAGPRFAAWPFYVQEPELALLKGELITVGGSVLTVWAWKLAGGQRFRLQEAILQSWRDKALLKVTYAMSVTGIIVSRLFPYIGDLTGQLLPVLHSMGIGVAALLVLSRVSRPIVRLFAVSILSVPFVVDALGKGMKESLILVLLPVAFFAWRAAPSKLGRMGLIAAGTLLVGLIAAYVGHFRDVVWRPKANLPTSQVVESFVASLTQDGALTTVAEGIENFLARNNASIHRGWAVSIADERGFEPELVFAPMAYVFVPRILWSGKPAIRQGWEYSGVVFGARYISWSDSSTAAGLYTSLYLGGWVFAVLFGAVLAGLIVAWATRAALRYGGRTAAVLYVFTLVPFAMRLDETWTVGALSGPVISLVYVLLLMSGMRIVRSVFWGGKPVVRLR